MTTQCVTYPLQTETITVMSHVTSIQVVGERISCLQATTETESDPAKTVHVTFEVQGKKDEPCILSNAEELGLILSAKDAVELGLSLIAMGSDPENMTDISAIRERLSDFLSNKSPV